MGPLVIEKASGRFFDIFAFFEQASDLAQMFLHVRPLADACRHHRCGHKGLIRTAERIEHPGSCAFRIFA